MKVKDMEFKGTEGDWIVEHDEFEGYSVALNDDDGGTTYIARNICQGNDEGEADAKLISASPEMCKALLELIDPLTGLVYDSIAKEIGKEKSYKIECSLQKALGDD